MIAILNCGNCSTMSFFQVRQLCFSIKTDVISCSYSFCEKKNLDHCLQFIWSMLPTPKRRAGNELPDTWKMWHDGQAHLFSFNVAGSDTKFSIWQDNVVNELLHCDVWLNGNNGTTHLFIASDVYSQEYAFAILAAICNCCSYGAVMFLQVRPLLHYAKNTGCWNAFFLQIRKEFMTSACSLSGQSSLPTK